MISVVERGVGEENPGLFIAGVVSEELAMDRNVVFPCGFPILIENN